MKNLYVVDVTHDYYVDVARNLESLGHRVRIIGANRSPEYWPGELDGFLSASKPIVTLWDDFNYPERFDAVFAPDYSILNLDVLERLAYYEKLFLMSSDRLSFLPIPEIEKCRLFYRYIAHFHRLLTQQNIDAVLFFGTPHGLWSIALFGLAKVLGLEVLYTDWVGLSPALSTIEKELHIRRSYSPREMKLGLLVNHRDQPRIRETVVKSTNAAFVWTATKHMNLPMRYLKMIGSLVLRRPLETYVSSEIFLHEKKATRIGHVLPLTAYFIRARRALRFYEKNAADEMPGPNSVALFLHLQPEASTMPMGGIFADQLLVLDLILASLPDGMNVYVKEHPFMFEALAQDKHERSVDFYKHMLRDPRVRFLKRSVSSKEILDKAGYIASTVGSISWEAMREGKPCITFGWAWFSSCKSCFVVDSVASLKAAFASASAKSRADVLADVEEFLSQLQSRLIYGASCRPALQYLGAEFDRNSSALNVARAIDAALLGSEGEHSSHAAGKPMRQTRAIDSFPNA
jgi:hypothetical protein